MIQVTMVSANTYRVDVYGRHRQATTHTVSMSQETYRELSSGRVTHEWVVIQTFQFLIERQNNTEIADSFDITAVAARYDDFRADLAARLAQ